MLFKKPKKIASHKQFRKKKKKKQYFPIASSYQSTETTLYDFFNTSLNSGVCLKKTTDKVHVYFSEAESCYHFYKVTYWTQGIENPVEEKYCCKCADS